MATPRVSTEREHPVESCLRGAANLLRDLIDAGD